MRGDPFTPELQPALVRGPLDLVLLDPPGFPFRQQGLSRRDDPRDLLDVVGAGPVGYPRLKDLTSLFHSERLRLQQNGEVLAPKRRYGLGRGFHVEVVGVAPEIERRPAGDRWEKRAQGLLVPVRAGRGVVRPPPPFPASRRRVGWLGLKAPPRRTGGERRGHRDVEHALECVEGLFSYASHGVGDDLLVLIVAEAAELFRPRRTVQQGRDGGGVEGFVPPLSPPPCALRCGHSA